MSYTRNMLAALAVAAIFSLAQTSEADAGYRQYYGSWSYHPSYRYYYRPYYYKPYTSYSGYKYHYCIHYPSRPRYVYYYNPHRRQYWGRFDLEGKDGAQYSLLKDEDRAEKLSDIPEEAFPKPAAMPAVPESEDGAQIEPPEGVPEQDLPEGAPATAPQQ
ncbi:hypothetical protein Mal4_51830 [Maioricimonas rarisocia]|uniref:Uncharacterized protein n=1 Tax=Maioricimonas rarisocia TaxID=2528026 RepID=A0A517ZEB0_9PLAN|nr:hypothetical protein [Maioricimonas rarisocia]QDU40821.1 hypothetical protein Mal4_51830 [Maioricimonas rarisocia]